MARPENFARVTVRMPRSLYEDTVKMADELTIGITTFIRQTIAQAVGKRMHDKSLRMI